MFKYYILIGLCVLFQSLQADSVDSEDYGIYGCPESEISCISNADYEEGENVFPSGEDNGDNVYNGEDNFGDGIYYVGEDPDESLEYQHQCECEEFDQDTDINEITEQLLREEEERRIQDYTYV